MAQNPFDDQATAAAYERLLLGRIFEPWGRLLLDRAGLAEGGTVLDVATGPGTIARMAAERVGRRGRVEAVDLSPQMLAEAKAKRAPEGAAPVTYTQAPADALPVPESTFDTVLCQQGVQFFPDQGAAAAQMRRVLKPGGHVAVSLWKDDTAMTLFSTFLVAFQETTGTPARRPLAWLEAKKLSALLEGAGFADVRVEEITLVAVFEGGMKDALACVDGTSAGAGVRALEPAQRTAYERRVEERLAPYARGDALELPATALVGVGKRSGG
jgi:ubiquinone/menaquinone biosynthesis C-methylase UbiE